MTNNYTDITKDKISTENKSYNQTKTTDINILLNRVKLKKKKKFKKKYNNFTFDICFSLFDCHLFSYLEHKSCLKVY